MGTLSRNVFLVGFCGVGKTTVARRLARDLGVAAIDVDSSPGAKVRQDANQLFKQRGEKGLRRAESCAFAECCAMGPAVISCGEGIVVAPKNRGLAEKREIHRPSRIFRRGFAGARQKRWRKTKAAALLLDAIPTSFGMTGSPLYEEVADVIG